MGHINPQQDRVDRTDAIENCSRDLWGLENGSHFVKESESITLSHISLFPKPPPPFARSARCLAQTRFCKRALLGAPTFGPDLSVRLICPECRDPNPEIAEEFGSGDLVCRNCGLVLGDRIVDTRSEWRTFANDEGDDPSRVGAASDPLLEGREQLDTIVSFRDGGSGLARELQRAASRAQSSRSERNLLTAFRDISNWCDQFSLPKTISDIAKQLYKRSDEEKLLRGKPLDAVIAACIFIACRQAHVPRTFREICNLTHVSKKLLGQCYKALEQAFNLTPGASATASTPGVTTGPEKMLARYCNHLDLPANVQSICADIIVTARELGIADGRSPVSIAGGAIYFTCNLLGASKPLKDISLVAGVSEGTIKLVYRLYFLDKEKLVKQEWIDAGKADLSRLPGPTVS
ncbi:Cyclin-like protein [Mycena indigotica]|uniref:Transcription initiation factor IIB n=1 Tax=Mycena indigotica TaxID=2126181 RepID=A0A8H6W537_9AGAR|nr:Cyclin-like protein [Mycena indigotica]KAF7302103.1 Cyclin-like protein [Mycena indigotica]